MGTSVGTGTSVGSGTTAPGAVLVVGESRSAAVDAELAEPARKVARRVLDGYGA
ncbi:hypothetical protein ABZ990_23575 [Streptomyces sp. NPDC046203]|uniref:hypothetical protein n=1 Tax=Streptomyces sp. NPDC046203 TaxID=3154602 RepID=UPI0033F19EC5